MTLDKYTGETNSKGQQHGQGTMTYPNGETYTGALKGGIPNGQGTYTVADGTKRTGEWKDGELDVIADDAAGLRLLLKRHKSYAVRV